MKRQRMHWENPETLAGQRLMLGFEGTRFNRDVEEIIDRFKAGGIILFRQNIESPDQVARLCSQAREFAASLGLPPLFIAVDQEGGTVARLRAPFTEFPGNPFIRTEQEAEQFARITAQELKGAGINMNLAPVMDVAPKGLDSIMKDRAFPGDAQRVSLLGCRVIKTLQENGIMAVAKHFPGIGRTIKDSHHFLPVLDIDPETLEEADIIPFAAAKKAGVSGIMLSHISYPRLDDQWQASLSPVIAGEMVRKGLGYSGLTLTDDLDMKAISHDMETCVHQILRAGIDLALICHQGPNMEIAFNEMVRLLETDEKLYSAGRESLDRIMAAKKKYLSELF
ncbi:glycoside hydrolase family 3 N-terminal domain-containing protein [Desulfospira joergensenii]|uniref:glycoside hydrolase family 3 N-terminal domain-containing protein n=1 Tax=Desulfospira joergensenii TaxID=53329 RepID=UPI001FC99959|nr:glycoside hydrolase family 3 N-terminal domain-containing protein [Desulfospira joergensenii]